MILPIYAGLERIPDSLLDASGDLGGARRRTFRARGPAARLPGGRGRLDLHVLADAGRLHHAAARRRARSSSATSSTPTSAWRTTCRSPPRSRRSRWWSWSSTSSSRGAPAPSRRCDARRRPRARGSCASAPASRSRSSTCRCVVIAIYAFNADAHRRRGRPPGFTLTWFEQGARTTPACASALWTSIKAGARRDRDRARARHAGRVRRRALSVLRPRERLVPRHPADRAAGHRHRHGAERDVHAGARRATLGAVHDRHRPRHVLHRRRLQQRRRPAAADGARRSRRPRPTSAPTRWQTFRSSRSRSCARRCSPAALLAFALSFDEVIVTTFTAGGGETLPIWISPQPVAAEPAAGRQRGGRGRDPALGRAGLPRPAPRRSGRRPLRARRHRIRTIGGWRFCRERHILRPPQNRAPEGKPNR